jgi:hypothetical protein
MESYLSSSRACEGAGWRVILRGLIQGIVEIMQV